MESAGVHRGASPPSPANSASSSPALLLRDASGSPRKRRLTGGEGGGREGAGADSLLATVVLWKFVCLPHWGRARRNVTPSPRSRRGSRRMRGVRCCRGRSAHLLSPASTRGTALSAEFRRYPRIQVPPEAAARARVLGRSRSDFHALKVYSSRRGCAGAGTPAAPVSHCAGFPLRRPIACAGGLPPLRPAAPMRAARPARRENLDPPRHIPSMDRHVPPYRHISSISLRWARRKTRKDCPWAARSDGGWETLAPALRLTR